MIGVTKAYTVDREQLGPFIESIVRTSAALGGEIVTSKWMKGQLIFRVHYSDSKRFRKALGLGFFFSLPGLGSGIVMQYNMDLAEPIGVRIATYINSSSRDPPVRIAPFGTIWTGETPIVHDVLYPDEIDIFRHDEKVENIVSNIIARHNIGLAPAETIDPVLSESPFNYNPISGTYEFKKDITCPSCGYVFVKNLQLASKHDKQKEVNCPKCGDTFTTVIDASEADRKMPAENEPFNASQLG